MNDRFLYRAICNDGKFHHGYLARLYKDNGYGKKGDFCISNSSFCPYAYLVTRPETIEQCTGLKDKDGKLIYEGDIVITYYNGEPTGQMYIYHWEAPAFYVEPFEKGKPSGRHYYYFAVENERCKVIGNIRENPDLLKNPENFNVSAENVKGDNK